MKEQLHYARDCRLTEKYFHRPVSQESRGMPEDLTSLLFLSRTCVPGAGAERGLVLRPGLGLSVLRRPSASLSPLPGVVPSSVAPPEPSFQGAK